MTSAEEPTPLADNLAKLLLLTIGGMVAARMAGRIVDRVVMHEMARCCRAAIEGFGPARLAISGLATYAALLAISLWQAERLGSGDVRTGIGDRPIAAKPLFLALWSALVLYLLIYLAVRSIATLHGHGSPCVRRAGISCSPFSRRCCWGRSARRSIAVAGSGTPCSAFAVRSRQG